MKLLSSADALILPGDGPLAIDTEFHAENHYHPRLHLIQVKAEGGAAYLIDPHQTALLAELAPALTSRPWLVHAGSRDLPLLERALGTVPSIVHDTQIAAGLVSSVYPAGLGSLLRNHCDVDLLKGETLSNWAQRPLTDAQCEYAADDVEHLHDLWNALQARARSLGREAIVALACAEARDRALAGPDLDVLWQSIPGSLNLYGAHANVLRALATWRELEAAAIDRAPGALLNNGVLLQLAKTLPTDREGVLSGRKAPKKVLESHMEGILAAIAEGLAMDEGPSALRPGTLLGARHAWLQGWSESHGYSDHWGSRLVLPPPCIAAAARGDGELEGWRDVLVGETWRQAWNGKGGIPWPNDRDGNFFSGDSLLSSGV